MYISSILPDIGLAVRVFANGPGDLDSIPGRVIPKTQKMVLDASLLNTQHYKVRIKGKVEQSRKGVAPSPTPWCSKLSKREPSGHPRLWSPTLLLLISSISRHHYTHTHTHIYIYVCVCVCVIICSVGWGSRIHRRHLCRGVRASAPHWESWI